MVKLMPTINVKVAINVKVTNPGPEITSAGFLTMFDAQEYMAGPIYCGN